MVDNENEVRVLIDKRYKVYERLLKFPILGYVVIERCCVSENIPFLDERFVMRIRNLREEDAVKRYSKYIPKKGFSARGKPVGLLGLLFYEF